MIPMPNAFGPLGCKAFLHKGCRLYAQNVRLRSANRGNANNTWNVNTSGNANNNNATNANRPAPDCVIPSSTWHRHRRCACWSMTQGAEAPARIERRPKGRLRAKQSLDCRPKPALPVREKRGANLAKQYDYDAQDAIRPAFCASLDRRFRAGIQGFHALSPQTRALQCACWAISIGEND